MKNKLILLLSAFVILFAVINTPKAYAENRLNFEVEAKSAYLMDYESNTVIYQKNENMRLPIASMTKLMILLLTFDNIQNGSLSVDEQIVVSENASSMGGSQVFLEANGSYLCADLIKSVIIASANDASVALAERLYGSESLAVDEMNERSKQMGLENTLFSNVTGLTKPTQYSCAKDVALILQKVCEHKIYFNFSKIWMDEIRHPSGNVTGLTNTNKLVRFYEGCDGGKTGFTNEAGFCLSATAKRGNMRLIGVVINEADSKTRFKDVSNMFNYGFANYTEKCLVEKGEKSDLKVLVRNGKEEYVDLTPNESYYVFTKKGESPNLRVEAEVYPYLKAPVKQGKKAGVVKILKGNEVVKEIDLVTVNEIKANSFKDEIINIAENW